MIGEEEKIENYNTIEPLEAKKAVVEAQERELTPRERIQELYKRELPKPKFDKTVPEYMKRSAKLNALSRGLSALGDIHAMGVGGNVNPATKDQKTGHYVDGYFKYLDNHKKRMEDYEYRDYMNKMNLGKMEIAEAQRQEGLDYRKGRDEEQDSRSKQQQDNWENQFAAAQDKWQKGYDRQGEQIEQNQKNFDTQQAYREKLPYINASLAERKRAGAMEDYIAKESMKLQFDKAKNAYVLYDNQGLPQATVNDEGDIQKLYDAITSDKEMEKEADALMTSMRATMGEGVTMGHMKIIVSKLWDRSDQARRYLMRGQYQEPKPVTYDEMQSTQMSTRPGDYPLPKTEQPATNKWDSYELK